MRQRVIVAAFACLLLGASGGTGAAQPGRVVSINLCTDQLLLELAEPSQILSLSWLASDPNESPAWREARRYATNQGSVEELLALEPDLILAGRYTGTFSKSFLARLGYAVLEIDPAHSVADMERNIGQVASRLGRAARGAAVLDALQQRVTVLAREAPARRRPAIIVQPGGFTVGADSLAHELLLLAGFENRAAEMGLDRWGSLSLEALLTSGAHRLIVASYRADAVSLANDFLAHRVFKRLQASLELVTVPATWLACGVPQALEAVPRMRATPAGQRS